METRSLLARYLMALSAVRWSRALHFRLRSGNALRSFLLLGDGSKLTLDTISNLDFRAIDLVTLSACETGLGGSRADDGREIEGLSALVQRRAGQGESSQAFGSQRMRAPRS
jgi:hypothetical protein